MKCNKKKRIRSVGDGETTNISNSTMWKTQKPEKNPDITAPMDSISIPKAISKDLRRCLILQMQKQ